MGLSEDERKQRREADRALMVRLVQHVMGKPLSKFEHGDQMEAYRKIAALFMSEESTPRMWYSRGRIPRNLRAEIVGLVEGKTPAVVRAEALEFAPAVTNLARTLQRLHDITGGKGDVWRYMTHAIDMALTWARRGLPVSLRHLRPGPSDRKRERGSGGG